MFNHALSIIRQATALTFVASSLIIDPWHALPVLCSTPTVQHTGCDSPLVACADNSQSLGLGARGMLKLLATVCHKDTRQVLARLVSPSFNVRFASQQPCRTQQIPFAAYGCARTCQECTSTAVLIKLCSCYVCMLVFICAEQLAIAFAVPVSHLLLA